MFLTKIRLSAYILAALAVSVHPAISQSSSPQSDTTRYSEIRYMISSYYFMLNTIGARQSTTRDKEVIIKESFRKIFRDEDVQIEDDLLENRSVITNKNVTAYLRDVDFFFTDVSFDFKQIRISGNERPNGQTYFVVQLESSINGTTLEKTPYKNTKQRFFEINVDEAAGDIKIASIYSTKMSRDKELQNWWESLSYGWKNIFMEHVPFDSLSKEVLLQISSIDSLDLSNKEVLLDMEPISALRDLIFLDISQTRIRDIGPARYAAGLKCLKANNTLIQDLSPVQYFEGLQQLEVSGTGVLDLSSLEKASTIRSLNLSFTQASSYEPINYLISLHSLDLSGTDFTDISLLEKLPIKDLKLNRTPINSTASFVSLKSLESLDLSETNINALDGLESHPALITLSINKTSVSNLAPLEKIASLKKVYADNAGVTQQVATAFMANRPSTVVVTGSKELESWWAGLTTSWKDVLVSTAGFPPAGAEDLVRLINTESLNLAGRKFNSGDPLLMFTRLKTLNISGNSFRNLSFLSPLTSLTKLSANDLNITDLDGLEGLMNLEVLSLRGTGISQLSSLHSLKRLSYLDVEGTQVTREEVKSLLHAIPGTVVVFDSQRLLAWWEVLDSEWKAALKLQDPDTLALHRLVESESLTIENSPIHSLLPLQDFLNLKEITLENVRTTSLAELNVHTALQVVTYRNGPLQTLEGIGNLSKLQSLDISNTAVDDLRPIENLTSIEKLNCSGTSIKNLKGVSGLSNLTTLNVSNTGVWKLTRLEELKKLRTLVCYNTRLSSSDIDAFKRAVPECDITFY